jgi:ankyrin repeat protein
MCGKWGSALHFLINYREYDEVNLAKLFLDAGANVNAIGGCYSTPLGAAVVNGEPGMVDTLLERGADPNLVWEKSGRFPLLLACRVKNPGYVNKLIKHGADVNGCTIRGSILQSAARGVPVEITERLIECGAKVNAVTIGPYGTALNAASAVGDLKNVKCLLNHGADITLTGGNFHSALQAAAFKSKLSVIRLLLKHGADVNATGGRYKTALQAACAAGRIKTAKLLLMNGADPNITGGQNGNALQAACIFGNAKLVRLLLSYGADPKLIGGWFGTALGAAVLTRNAAITKVLLAENIGTDLLEEKISHIEKGVWEGNKKFLDDVLADDEPLEAFDPDEIVLPEENEDEKSPATKKEPLKIVTAPGPSLEPVNGELTAGPSPIGFGSNSLLVAEV